MSANPRSLGIAALLFATTGWGGLFLLSKGALAQVDPTWFTVIRYGISGLVFAVLLGLRGAAPWRKLRAHALPLAVRGFAGFGVFSVLLLTGLAHSVPSHGAVIMATIPMSTQLLRWVLDGIRPTRATLLTSALALAGVVVVSGVLAPAAASGASTWRGDAMALVSTLGWVWYTRGAARFSELDVVEYTGLTVLASLPLLLLGLAGLTMAGLAHVPSVAGLALSWPVLLYVGLIASAAAVLSFNYGVRALGPVMATAFLNFVPVSVLLINAAMGKLPSPAELAGTAMVIAALLINAAASRPGAEPLPAGKPVRQPAAKAGVRARAGATCSSSAA